MGEQNDVERCEFMHVHEDIVNQVNESMPDEEILYDLAELFKIFGDSTRIKIRYVLFESGDVRVRHRTAPGHDSVGHLPPAPGAQAEQAGVPREGKTVFYSLADGHVRTILDQGMEHVAE